MTIRKTPASTQVKEETVTADDKSFTVLLTNHLDEELAFGEEPCLEREEDGTWKAVETRENVAWHDIAHILRPGESGEDTVYLSGMYKELTPGHYRYSKKMTGESGSFMARAEFDIK